jgi:hypothetical protein
MWIFTTDLGSRELFLRSGVDEEANLGVSGDLAEEEISHGTSHLLVAGNCHGVIAYHCYI